MAHLFRRQGQGQGQSQRQGRRQRQGQRQRQWQGRHLFRAEVVSGLRAVQRVLAWHVPVVPDEAHRVGLPRLGKVLVEAPTQLAREVSVEEVLDDT